MWVRESLEYDIMEYGEMEDKGAVSDYLSEEYEPFKDNIRIFQLFC